MGIKSAKSNNKDPAPRQICPEKVAGPWLLAPGPHSTLNTTNIVYNVHAHIIIISITQKQKPAAPAASPNKEAITIRTVIMTIAHGHAQLCSNLLLLSDKTIIIIGD